jgi:hypothetical protein
MLCHYPEVSSVTQLEVAWPDNIATPFSIGRLGRPTEGVRQRVFSKFAVSIPVEYQRLLIQLTPALQDHDPREGLSTLDFLRWARSQIHFLTGNSKFLNLHDQPWRQIKALTREVPRQYLASHDENVAHQVLLGAIKFLIHYHMSFATNHPQNSACANRRSINVDKLTIASNTPAPSKKRSRDYESDSFNAISSDGERLQKKSRIDSSKYPGESSTTIIKQATARLPIQSSSSSSSASPLALRTESTSSSEDSSKSDDEDTDAAAAQPDQMSKWHKEARMKYSMMRIAAFQSRGILPKGATIADLDEYDRRNSKRTLDPCERRARDTMDHEAFSSQSKLTHRSKKSHGKVAIPKHAHPGEECITSSKKGGKRKTPDHGRGALRCGRGKHAQEVYEEDKADQQG